MSNTLDKINIFIIPGWIYRSLLRNKLNTVDVADYAKMRKILSTSDLAEWVYVNNALKIEQCFISGRSLEYSFNALTQDNWREITNSVLPLSKTEEIALSTTGKLNSTISYSMSESAYQFINIGSAVYLILNEGFLSDITKPGFKLEFVKDYLKQCYAIASINDVSQLDMYQLYLQQF